MTATEIRRIEARRKRAFLRSKALLVERDAAILAGLDAGLTHAVIAEATGLTRGRIGQMAMRAKGR